MFGRAVKKKEESDFTFFLWIYCAASGSSRIGIFPRLQTKKKSRVRYLFFSGEEEEEEEEKEEGGGGGAGGGGAGGGAGGGSRCSLALISSELIYGEGGWVFVGQDCDFDG